jgi:hypothetical protein
MMPYIYIKETKQNLDFQFIKVFSKLILHVCEENTTVFASISLAYI